MKITYGEATLSVQASQWAYCEPRVDGLKIDEYESVEVAVLDADGELVRPSAVGVAGFDDLFEPGNSPVAGYVSQSKLLELKRALRANSGGPGLVGAEWVTRRGN